MYELNELLVKRKSVRAFTKQLVAKEMVEKILNYAKYAPSGTNTQPWQVVVVSGKTKSELDDLLIQAFRDGKTKAMDYLYYPQELTHTMKRRRVECGLQMFKTLQIERNEPQKRLLQWEQNYSGFGAPVVIYVFLPKCVEKGSFLDCGMFIQSIALMATSLGLATCIQAALAEQPEIVRTHLAITQDLQLICGIALGYEDINAPVNSYRTDRAKLDEFVQFFD